MEKTIPGKKMATGNALRCLSSNICNNIRIIKTTTAFKHLALKRNISVFSSCCQRYFSKDHEWIDVDGKIGKVGITNYAQEKLGELVYVELPEIDSEVEMNESIGAVESVKAASDILTPVGGIVKETNSNVVNSPSIINEKSESEGWLYTIELTEPSELDDLLSDAQYKGLVAQEES